MLEFDSSWKGNGNNCFSFNCILWWMSLKKNIPLSFASKSFCALSLCNSPRYPAFNLTDPLGVAVKGYLRCKTIFCNKVAPDVLLMHFFIWRKSNALFSRYLQFCVFVKSTDFKIGDVIIGIAALRKLHLRLFLLNPTYYQNEIWSKYWCAVWLYGSMLETGN